MINFKDGIVPAFQSFLALVSGSLSWQLLFYAAPLLILPILFPKATKRFLLGTANFLYHLVAVPGRALLFCASKLKGLFVRNEQPIIRVPRRRPPPDFNFDIRPEPWRMDPPRWDPPPVWNNPPAWNPPPWPPHRRAPWERDLPPDPIIDIHALRPDFQRQRPGPAPRPATGAKRDEIKKYEAGLKKKEKTFEREFASRKIDLKDGHKFVCPISYDVMNIPVKVVHEQVVHYFDYPFLMKVPVKRDSRQREYRVHPMNRKRIYSADIHPAPEIVASMEAYLTAFDAGNDPEKAAEAAFEQALKNGAAAPAPAKEMAPLPARPQREGRFVGDFWPFHDEVEGSESPDNSEDDVFVHLPRRPGW